QRDRGNAQCMRKLDCVQAEECAGTSHDRGGELGGVIKTLLHYRSAGSQAAFHFVGDRKSRENLLARSSSDFSRCEDRANVVAGVTCFPFGEEIVHEVDVSRERRVETGGAIRRGLSSTNQAADRLASELL